MMTQTTEECDMAVKSICDQLVQRAGQTMVEQAGASTEMMIDRLFTFAIAHACMLAGSADTAKMLRQVADNIDGGMFAHLDARREGQKH